MGSHNTTNTPDTNMKIFVIACLVAAASCRPQEDPIPVAILRQDNTGVVGAVFSHEFEADNGIIQAKSGAEGSAGQSNLQGSFIVPLEDGSLGTITYVADENGYQPQSDLIPAVPAHVVEMLEFVAAQQAAGLTWDQSANAWV